MGSRRSLFEELDRPALRPLPTTRYEPAEWKTHVGVSIDYHIEFARHYYSVPYQLTGKRVDVRATATTVECFYRHRRVASHRRSTRPGHFTTDPTHRPKSHQRYAEWSPSRLIRWAESIGAQTATVVERILHRKPHPEQGFRTCLGILRLAKRHGRDRLEQACGRSAAPPTTTDTEAPMLTEETLTKLSQMRLHGFAHALTQQLDDDQYDELTFAERVGLLVDREWTEREARRLTRRLQHAKLREPACVEDLDYRHARGLDRTLMQRLATCEWITKHQNLIIEGPTGVGKTFIACALAQKACRDGHTALYRRVPRLLHELLIARADGSYSRLLIRIAKTDLLVVDDWGLAPLADQERRDLLEVLEDRWGNRSTLVAAQLPVAAWHKIIGEPTVADAIVDRLVHNAHRLTLKGESMRKTRSPLTPTKRRRS